MEVERHHERDGVRWEVARRRPAPALRPLLGQALEGWTRDGTERASFRELPFPGTPLILNLGAPWQVEEERLDSFLAGLQPGRPPWATTPRSPASSCDWRRSAPGACPAGRCTSSPTGRSRSTRSCRAGACSRSARVAGAEVVREPTDTDYGSREYDARDPEGLAWRFGTYQPFAAAPSAP